MNFDYSIHVNEYGFYCIPDEYRNREVPKILMKGKVYELNTLKLLRRTVGSGDIISGGAFIGDFFPAISTALSDKARLYTFEPNPLSFEAAKMTIALNRLGNIALSQVAVGAESGALNLQIARNKGGEAMAARAKIVEDADDGETIEVEVTTLDEMVPKSRRVSVLHLDIEGHELPAVDGARRIIETSKPMIVLEAAKRWNKLRYLDYLNERFPKHGYRLAGSMERNAFFLPSGS